MSQLSNPHQLYSTGPSPLNLTLTWTLRVLVWQRMEQGVVMVWSVSLSSVSLSLLHHNVTLHLMDRSVLEMGWAKNCYDNSSTILVQELICILLQHFSFVTIEVHVLVMWASLEPIVTLLLMDLEVNLVKCNTYSYVVVTQHSNT